VSYPQSSAFWTASTAFWGAITANGRAKAKGYNPPLSKAERKADLWTRRGEHYLRGQAGLFQRLGGSAKVQVLVDPELTQDVLRTLDRMAPAVAAVWDRHLGALALNAFRNWPVATGLSRALIQLDYIADGDQFVGRVKSAAPYTYFIAGSPHWKLIRTPGRALGIVLGREVLAAGHLDAGGP